MAPFPTGLSHMDHRHQLYRDRRRRIAAKMLTQIIEFIKRENAPFARALWQRFEAEYSDTEEYKKAKERDIPGLLQELERKLIEIEAAYRRVERKIKILVLNKLYDEALRVLESDGDYQRFKTNPRFKALRDDIESKRNVNP